MLLVSVRAAVTAGFGSWRLTALSGSVVLYFTVMYLIAWRRRKVHSATNIGQAAQVSFRGSLVILFPLYVFALIGFIANLMGLVAII